MSNPVSEKITQIVDYYNRVFQMYFAEEKEEANEKE